MVNNPHILLFGTGSHLAALIDLLCQAGAKALLCETPVTVPDTKPLLLPVISRNIADAYQILGKIDTLVFFDQLRPQETLSPDPTRIVQETLSSVSRLLLTARCTALKMIENHQSGQIVLVCNTSAVAGRSDSMISSTVGGALIGMSKSLAKELGRYQIAVNILCLGLMEDCEPPQQFTDMEKIMLKASGLGKSSTLQHLANNITYLAGGDHWMNGQILHMNDGLVM